MRLLVFQHLDIEHPGIFRDFLAADRIEWDVVELDANASIPALDDYAALLVMGGPMDVWEEEEHPWLITEKRAIREAVAERRMPYLGICLGHQLLADALGGTVGKMPEPEVGMMEVELTDVAQRDPVFSGMAATVSCLQWHGAAVLEPPLGASVLATSPRCDVQAMRVGSHAWGIQYHVEVTEQTVPQWAAIPAYKAALERTLGAGAAQKLAADTQRQLSVLARDARVLYDNFMRIVRASAHA